MSNVNQAISEINSWWLNDGQAHAQDIVNFQKKAKGYRTQADTINNRKSGINVIKILSNVWHRATRVPELTGKIDKLSQEESRLTSVLSVKSAEDSAKILFVIATENGDVGTKLTEINSKLVPLIEARSLFSEVYDRTESLLSVIQCAWEEVNEAQDWEKLDIIGNNVGFSLLSHRETSEAVEHLEKVSDQLKEYKEYMSQTQKRLSSLQLTSLRGEAITKTAEWDLWAGVLDVSIVSFFTSWRNHGQLGNAKEKLETLEKQIQPMLEQSTNLLLDSEPEYNEVASRYVDLQSSVVNNANLPSLFYDFMPKVLTEEPIRQSLVMRFDI